jgi:hypothetical protein
MKTILKMNFNFNIKDMLLTAQQSIRGLQPGVIWHHNGQFRDSNASACSEGFTVASEKH